MTGQTSLGYISDVDYANLLRALSANATGRAFLDEYRRRARPDDAEAMFGALQRIESVIRLTSEQLRPQQIAEELKRIAMTLEIAADGAGADPEGDEAARRMALVGKARRELAVLAGSLAAN